MEHGDTTVKFIFFVIAVMLGGYGCKYSKAIGKCLMSVFVGVLTETGKEEYVACKGQGRVYPS